MPAEVRPGVYRAPMRSRRDDVDPVLAIDRALDLGVCGLGGRLPRPPTSLADAVRQTDEAHGERAAARLERFAAVARGAVVWTHHPHDGYVRGVLTGPWRYDATAAAQAADLVHVRDCAWDQPGDLAAVPAAVLATYARGGRNFQRIRSL